jgi:hypothetical protein
MEGFNKEKFVRYDIYPLKNCGVKVFKFPYRVLIVRGQSKRGIGS